MLVMGVVRAPRSCGTEKRPFGFGRTCVPEERTEERTKERTWDWRERRVSSPPKGMEPGHHHRRKRSVKAQPLSGLAGPGGLSLQVRSLSCTMSRAALETMGFLDRRLPAGVCLWHRLL